MNNNWLASKTLTYIWNHPANQRRQVQAISRFLGWQIRKRITRRSLDINWSGNMKLRCYPDSRSASASLYCGLYDYDEMFFLQRFLQNGDSFLDVGANVGIYTLLAAQQSPAGQIYSIEALPKNVVRLNENLSLNQFNNITVYELAVSSYQGHIPLDLADGDSTPSISVITAKTEQSDRHSLQVSTDTLNNLMVGSIERLTLAKMDIEGAELLALKGATLLLQQHRPMVWILEINSQIQNFDYTAEDLVDFLDSHDYGLYKYSADNNQVYPISLGDKTGNNVLAIARPFLGLVHQRLNIPDVR